MIQSLKNRYWGDNVSNERKIFNILHVISVIGLTFTILLVYLYIPDRTTFYLSVATVILAILTLVEANRVNNTRIPAIIMSVFFNFIFLSMVYLSYGRIVCMIPVYFIFGLLYSALLIDGNIGIIMAIIETVYYVVLIFYGNRVQVNASDLPVPSILDYSGVLVAVIISGIFGGLAVKYKIRIQQAEREAADKLHELVMKDYLSKDIFLINMSHEIRTPMNAIVGTVNLLLDQNVNDRVHDSVYSILNSCNALLSITNELMEISQSDSNAVLINKRYDLYDLIMEIVNMMSVRLMDSAVNLYVEITDTVPKYLYSDSSKIRQLLINILNNAVKYTKTGMIILRINATPIDDENVTLYFEVEDTGIGIKEENIPKLFSVYERVQEGEEIVRNTEGTGLGLAICKDILNKLNGEIHVKSQFHIGTTFYFSFPQKIEPGNMLLNLKDKDKYESIIYERDEESQEMLKKVFDSLKLKYACPEDDEDLERMILSHKYTHIFIAYEKYMDCIKFLDNGINNEKLIILSNITQMVSLNRYGSILTRPAHALNISSALSNENNNYVHEVIKKGGFTCPDATILVVDDNLTNLTVAEGLLKKYNAKVITALSGKECLNILESNDVDIIFLDYMMPEMNGIDTLLKIRAMSDPKYKTLPVVALTANVVNGAKEMFLQAGFNYYISKPIEIDRIERALKTFLNRDLLQINNR